MQVKSLVTKCTKILTSLIEGKPDIYILDAMCQSLDYDHLFDTLKSKYLDFKASINVQHNRVSEIISKVDTHYDSYMMDAFQIFILIKNLSSHSTDLANIINQITDPDYEDADMHAALHYFTSSTQSIEILFNQHLITVYFPVQPITRYLSKNTRTKLMVEIPRESPNEKI